MKINNKYIGIIGLLLMFSMSCSDSDEIVDQINDGVTRGAILRTIDLISNSVAINSATNVLNAGEEFSVVLEFQDNEDGNLLDVMNVFVSYDDNTDDDVDNSRAEVLVEAIPASSFTAGSRGFPQIAYAISAQEMQSVVGLSNEQLGLGGDRFRVRFEVVLTDGRVFSQADNSGTITGSFFNSPFLYNVNVVCAPSQPTAGTWQVSTTDTFGDGWNGGALNIVLDSGAPISIANIDDGVRPFAESVQDFTFDVLPGTSTISITYASGAFDEEVLFTITSANGNVVAEFGTNPPVATELLDFCPDNL